VFHGSANPGGRALRRLRLRPLRGPRTDAGIRIAADGLASARELAAIAAPD